MTYKASKAKVPGRAPELLGSSAPVDPNNPLGPRFAPEEQIAPGLFPGEALYEIDGVGLAAVSVDTRRLENGAGIAITAKVRAIEPDGTSKTDPHGQEIATGFSPSFEWAYVEAMGSGDLDAGQKLLEKEVLLAVMGEDGGTVAADPAHDVDERPVLRNVDRATISIVRAAKASQKAGRRDVAALLKG